eukprot:gb/GFBE01040807.1/.p1 GENE.gb/GFBE01040807.1/~~gb/GFBE01040807.1/.p1  ORF type:complete len:461 (+),score=103.64 gb/GFBE01040807.1/:1-1383(+)
MQRSLLAALSALLVVQAAAAAACEGGCSGHGSCGLLGTCICEGDWAGRDCSFQLSLELPEIETHPKYVDNDDVANNVQFLAPARQPEVPAQRSSLAFAQARRGARDAWAAADRLFAAAKHESSRDAAKQAKSKTLSAPGRDFAGMQVKQSSRRCQNDCSGNGECLDGKCRCSTMFAGEDCSRELLSASMLSLRLAAEKERLEKQQNHGQRTEKACALDCDGHGSCRGGVCECHDGWSGPACQDYARPSPVTLEQAATPSCADPLCSGNGACQAGVCSCSDGYGGAACEHHLQQQQESVDTQPLQLQLQQVTEEDKLASGCLGGCGGHGSCQAGLCDCEPGWQGTSCEISAEAALHGPEPQRTVADVPRAASWIASEVSQASNARPRALRAVGQDSKLASLLASSANIQQEAAHTSQPSAMGTAAATALHTLLADAAVSGQSNRGSGLAALIKSVIAAPED